MTRSLINEISDIIWIQTGFLGDIVLTTGAISQAAQSFPGIRQHLITTSIGNELLRDHPHLKSITTLDKSARNPMKAFSNGKRQLFENLSNKKTSVVTLRPHRSFRSGLLAWYLGFPTITYEESNLSFLAAKTIPRIAVLHEAQRIALLLEPLGLPRDSTLKTLPFLTHRPESPLLGSTPGIHGSSQKHTFIGVAPGSNWGTKRWRVSGFQELVCRLLEEDPTFNIVLIGSTQERSLADEVAQAVTDSGRIWNLAGKTTLDDLRSIFPKLALMISNDSSTVHFASAFRVPCVAIFGATVPEMGFSPLSPDSRSLGVNLPCRPCSAHGPMMCPLKHFRCMNDLDSETVFNACMDTLKHS